MEKNNTVTKDYQILLQELQSIINKGLNKAYKAIDNILVQTYWQVGERIVREELKHKERAEYGKYIIPKLANDLGFKKRRLQEIIQFYRAYPIVRSLTAQLSWTHYTRLILIQNEKERDFYQNKTSQNSWSVRQLRRQIKAKLYENTTPEEIEKTLQTKLPAIEAPEIFKGIYNFNFLDIKTKDEHELENRLVKNIEIFLKELGEYFSFAGRQIPIKIDTTTHYIDLVLYHRGIPCNILVELKTTKFDSKYVGQMNKYINYYRKNRQFPHEQDTIGLIICQHAGKEEIQYALDGLKEKIFVATYKTLLPSDRQIREAIQNS